ncbi:hypothetical protein TVAG_297640 [Trichomonas vaginalis G3]|uniref:non-specific serine/threonine protein kinase n=1 Tax=Trichomonas vaginalis (strain ATCC PRA-98 / G3) TaxID=412133 RepID=A2DRF9_TRIV3|nr:ribonuclease protein [Trichomonas vaginalis G3]EAY17085.1 hypothetical protein TVAG_297640 [Trichomonas vaginalis G3]KAI5517957.1 ribonuclease protein [Trichomonas vaginalis G3]|eukprot:XP_001329308.1 hypothetical protein [Trichomonas vaginalis G3]
MIVAFLALCRAEQQATSGLIETGLKVEWTCKTHGKKIFLATADGYITCVNIMTGDILWRIPTGSHMFNYTSTGRSVYIPSIDGFMFTFVPKYGYKRLSLPIRDLAYMSPFRTETGEIFSSTTTTTMIYVDPDNGTIHASYKPNEVMPRKEYFNGTLDNDTVIIRTDYVLNVYDNTNEIVRFTDFDIYSSEADYDTCVYDVKINSAFNHGGLYISINDSQIVSQIRVKGSPINIFGYNNKFTFELFASGERLPKSKVYFTSTPYGPIAIPSRPLKKPSKFEILMKGLPAIEGTEGVSNNNQINGYGLFDVRRPFVVFQPLNPRSKTSTDLVDPDPVRFVKIEGFSKFHYQLVAVSLVAVFVFFRMIQILLKILIKDKSTTIPLEIDKNDPLNGTYGETRVTIIRVPFSEQNNLSYSRIQRLTKPLHTPKLYTRQIIKTDDIFAYQMLHEIDYSTISSFSFCKTLLETLKSIHNEGLVHLNISTDLIFSDNEGNPILAGIEWSSAEKTDEDAANNIKQLGDILTHKFDQNKIDPLLKELIYDMTLPKWTDRPTAEEALQYPLFMTASQKINEFHTLNAILSSNLLDPVTLYKFEEPRIDIMQCVFWKDRIPKELVSDLQLRGEHGYSYDSLKDLVRMIRNKYQHRSELKDKALIKLTESDESYFNFFNERFPNLFLYCYYFNRAYGNDRMQNDFSD